MKERTAGSGFSDLNEEARRVWDAIAAWWDDRIGDGNAFQDELIEPATERLLDIRPGATVLDVTAPDGWSYTHMGDMVWWEADDPTPSGAGIAELHSLDTMIITYDGVLPIIFTGPVLVDLDGNPPFTMSDWVVSSVPEPASATVLLLTTAFLARRRARG